MKKVLLLPVIFLLFFSLSFAQQFKYLEKIKFKTIEDYAKVEDDVLKVTDYLLSHPLDKDDIDRYYGIRFLMDWISGCAYTFTIYDEAVKISKPNKELFSIYLAAMVNYYLNNKEAAKDKDLVRIEALKRTLEYIKQPEFNVRKNKYIKKLLKAEAAGNLKSVLE